MKSRNGSKQKKRSKTETNDSLWWKNPIVLAASIGVIGTIIAAIFGVFSVNLTPQASPTPQPTSTTASTATLSIVDQISILGATATKSAEITATQDSTNLRNTAEVELTLQQIRTEVVTTETQNAVATIHAAETSQALTATTFSNMTATVQASDAWREQHQFVDEFTEDTHGWSGNNKTAIVYLDLSNGTLNFETNENSRITFWKCDVCSIPIDHNYYSFEVKYFAPQASVDFNFGLLFGCDQFDEDLVSCQAIQIINQSHIRLVKTGTSKEYQASNYIINPNEKGLVSVRWEVLNQQIKLWVNNQLVMNNIELDGGPGGFFGFYSDPPGSKIIFERIEITPLP